MSTVVDHFNKKDAVIAHCEWTRLIIGNGSDIGNSNRFSSVNLVLVHFGCKARL